MPCLRWFSGPCLNPYSGMADIQTTTARSTETGSRMGARSLKPYLRLAAQPKQGEPAGEAGGRAGLLRPPANA